MTSHVIGYSCMDPKREPKVSVQSFWDATREVWDMDQVAKDVRDSINYHHVGVFSHHFVPELGPEKKFQSALKKAVIEYKDFKELGIKPVLVLDGPLTYLLLSKPEALKGSDKFSFLDAILPIYKEVIVERREAGDLLIKLDETNLVMDIGSAEYDAFKKAYSVLGEVSGVKLLVETYFTDLHGEAYLTLIGLESIADFGVDVVRGAKNHEFIKEHSMTAGKTLFAGIVVGINIWANDLAASVAIRDGVNYVVQKISGAHDVCSSIKECVVVAEHALKMLAEVLESNVIWIDRFCRLVNGAWRIWACRG